MSVRVVAAFSVRLVLVDVPQEPPIVKVPSSLAVTTTSGDASLSGVVTAVVSAGADTE